ncbi:hypothetical protein D0861_01253 [Hortaea werneckii]|uniref:Uncharacterized protein n=1 Tax=Hortaea werneckii TaxID=91943 RepID=A0A3M7G195_HORWE|nr:hypothetical protein D0861_01253 [Hortaea werneckii]
MIPAPGPKAGKAQGSPNPREKLNELKKTTSGPLTAISSPPLSLSSPLPIHQPSVQ